MKGRDVILGLLMEKSMSGYEIKQHFESIFSYFFDASYGTIYPTLNKMEQKGLITKENVIQEGKPNKNIYSITENGKELFTDYMNDPIENDIYRSDFLMRLYFGHYVDNERLGQWLKGAIEDTKNMILQLEKNYENWKPFMTSSQEICIQIGIHTNKAKLDTLQHHLKNYRHTHLKEDRHESL